MGDIRDDGMVFVLRKPNGREWWVSKYHYEDIKRRSSDSSKKWARKNPDKISQRNKNYYKNNRERELERVRINYRSNPERSREKLLKRRFGITIKKYEEILKSQNGVCAICESLCRSGKNLSVDHCHKTGKVRGLLCVDCNLGIANLKESKEIFQKASEYVEKFKSICN